jgi:hypothetical protein
MRRCMRGNVETARPRRTPRPRHPCVPGRYGGTVTSCDIVRDFKTGDSLCYGFIGAAPSRPGAPSPGARRALVGPRLAAGRQRTRAAAEAAQPGGGGGGAPAFAAGPSPLASAPPPCPLAPLRAGFDTEKACETAYFKFNNALIDDRRIKVWPGLGHRAR